MQRPSRSTTPVTWLLPALVLLIPSLSLAARPDPEAASSRPDRATIQRFGPAYRYPRAGWIVLHVEGSPYERGYQHGRLLAPEIADYVTTLATKRSEADPASAWHAARTAANALFLRGYDGELLEEMRGTADGAAAAGATFEGRPLDFLDIVTVNSEIELDFVENALDATATGLESRSFKTPDAAVVAPSPPEHCSAFAASGPATADGKVVIGHITMFSLHFARHFNVWLDIKPERGHRVLMQTYPGGVQSGMDYYMNDAGLVVAETTIKQTRFDIAGRPLASRIRMALQRCDSIDGVVAALRDGNNGLYTNEWLLADTKTSEVAMLDLGTRKSRLWRSRDGEWFGGTKGFYWGCNNAKDVEVRLESVAGLEGRPANLVFRPSDRDRTWLRLFDREKSRIGTAFGFEAFTTPPLAASHSLDAKFTTTDMARELKTWALFGPPMGKTWDPSAGELKRFPKAKPLVPNDWTILSVEPPVQSAANGPAALAVDLAPGGNDRPRRVRPRTLPTAWHGTILPASDADTWLAAGFADYERIVSLELALTARSAEKKRPLSTDERDELALERFAPFSQYRTAVARGGTEVPLSATRSSLTDDGWYHVAAGKGVLLLAELRKELGDPVFLTLMDDFGRAHAGKPVTTKAFRDAVKAAVPDRDLGAFFHQWLDATGLPSEKEGFGGFWSVDSFLAELDRAIIVYGTLRESDAQREAAQRLQRQVERSWSNVALPILSDRDATAEKIAGRHLLLIGRPETNALTARLAPAFPVTFGPASFVLRAETYAHPGSAVIAAAARPDDPRSSLVLFAGLSAEATWRCVEEIDGGSDPAEIVLIRHDHAARQLVVGARKPEPRLTGH